MTGDTAVQVMSSRRVRSGKGSDCECMQLRTDECGRQVPWAVSGRTSERAKADKGSGENGKILPRRVNEAG